MFKIRPYYKWNRRLRKELATKYRG